jgi:hypothetical protein
MRRGKMPFIIFIIAWLILLVLFLSSGGEPEKDSPAMVLGWLCIGLIVLVALYTMFEVSFRAGLGMIGTLYFFTVKNKRNE